MGGSGGTDVCLRGVADGCVAPPAQQRRCVARGAHVASPMLPEGYKAALPCRVPINSLPSETPSGLPPTPHPMTRRLKFRIDPEGVDAPLNEQDAVVIAVLCAVLQPILIAVQWPSLPVPVLACRALFLQILRNQLPPQVGY